MKTVEEKSEGDFVKKKEKRKKGQDSLPQTKNRTVDDETLTEVKTEKKKAKKADAVVVEEEPRDGGDGKGKKKKNKKEDFVPESLNDANGSDVKNENDEQVSKKKKKKKKCLDDAENQVETLSLVKEEDGGKKQSKEKKTKDKSVQSKSVNVKMEKEEEEDQQAGDDIPPKKAKKAKNCILVGTTEETEAHEKKKKKNKKTHDDETTDARDGISGRKKKNKAKMKVAEDQVKLETPEGEPGEVQKRKSVKNETKKRLKMESVQNELEVPRIKGKNKTIKAEKDGKLTKKKDTSTKSEIVSEEGETELKTTGKKRKTRKASVEVSEVEETEPKKKKRKKGKSKGGEEETPPLERGGVEEDRRETLVTEAGDTAGKKRKKVSIKEVTQEENVSLESGSTKKKKKKIKEEVEDVHEKVPQVDVVFLSEKSGNTDEVIINQERRLALQIEIDQASQPQKPARPTGLGQWSTAQFDSSDQQQKFLRLMGGFKKGFQPAAGNTGRANMAMGKDAQQQLQQGLLGDFERAQSRRVDFNNRGAGLGFAAPSNKKFAIDINSRRSVRFDD